ncbi:hypothetical protein M0R01_05025, partial [bacterium]|nr:hypothetical protein [bacterium]
SVGGSLSIYSQAKLEAPNLKSVGGSLSIYSQAKLDSLKSVGGDLSINSQAKLEAPNLKSVGGSLSINSQAKLDSLKSVGGYLSIYSQAKLEAPNLKSVGCSLSIYSKISEHLTKVLLENHSTHQWYLNEKVPERLLQAKLTRVTYKILDVGFDKALFDKVRKDKLTAQEVFGLENLEQRRIAYQFMDKTKMKDLKKFKALKTVKNDGYGYKMQTVQFEIEGFTKPFIYLNAFCPSTGREYFIETDKTDPWEAKMGSFGLDKNVRFAKEY